MGHQSQQQQQQVRNLKDLLSEDQEPFHLPNYIADKRSSTLPIVKHKQLKKQSGSSSSSSLTSKLCVKTACFLSSSFPTDSPAEHYFTTRSSKSPIMLSPLHKSPLSKSAASGSPSAHSLFLHVPAKTASLLLDAALRIHRSSTNNCSNSNSQPKPESSKMKSSGFGMLGSVIKRITRRNRTRKLESIPTTTAPEIEEEEVVDVVRWADSVMLDDYNDDDEVSHTRDLRKSKGRRSRKSESSTLAQCEKFDLSEELQSGRLEKKFIDLGCVNGVECSTTSTTSTSLSLSSSTTTSSSSSNSCCSHSRDESEDDEILREKTECDDDDVCEDFTFCLSPVSPFRLALYRTPSPDCRPVSPSTMYPHEEDTVIDSSSSSFRQQQEEEEEDKEQNSPVSVLDAPFEDDAGGEYSHGSDNNIDYDHESTSYEFVQRSKQHLLHKLRNLADIKPIHLEYSFEHEGIELVVDIQKPGMKRLISDLIFEEHERAASHCSSTSSSSSTNEDYDLSVVKRVCKRLESWEEIKPDTIHMMVEVDFKRENDRNSEWRGVCKEEEEDCVVSDVEVLIFEELLDQLLLLLTM